jgi:hypothetical protein
MRQSSLFQVCDVETFAEVSAFTVALPFIWANGMERATIGTIAIEAIIEAVIRMRVKK